MLPSKHVGRVVTVLLGLVFGAVLTYLLSPLLGRSAPNAAHTTAPSAQPINNGWQFAVPPGLPARAPVDPAVARLGTDDAGSRSPRTLLLIGTSPGQNARDGTARIGTDPRNPQTYAAGAILLNGARLAEIYTDHVVLERGRESVRLYVQGRVPTAHSPLLEVGGHAASDTTPVGPVASDDSRTRAITTYIRPNPIFSGEQLQGFALEPGSQPATFAQLGLARGDVLTAINGVPVTDGEQVMDMLEQVTAGGAVTATVQRGGRTEQLTLDGALITAARPNASLLSAGAN